MRIESCGTPCDLTYLQSLAGDSGPVFTTDQSAALLMDWTGFVNAASAVWLNFGPMDIYPDRALILPTGGAL